MKKIIILIGLITAATIVRGQSASVVKNSDTSKLPIPPYRITGEPIMARLSAIQPLSKNKDSASVSNTPQMPAGVMRVVPLRPAIVSTETK